ncbi:hypothetical protein FLONG3_11063, partial [Fusarium longipes]
ICKELLGDPEVGLEGRFVLECAEFAGLGAAYYILAAAAECAICCFYDAAEICVNTIVVVAIVAVIAVVAVVAIVAIVATATAIVIVVNVNVNVDDPVIVAAAVIFVAMSAWICALRQCIRR